MRIVIRVIASPRVGLGHVYRALTLAEEFKKLGHDVVVTFLASQWNTVTSIIGSKWSFLALADTQLPITNHMDGLRTELVINDILDTDAAYVKALKEGGCKVVNFEDLGPGADHADLVVNALFQSPQRQGDHYLWGIDHFFLRDEFAQARPAEWSNRVDTVLVTFGGTDPTNLTEKVVDAIAPECRDRRILLEVVMGPGFPWEAEVRDTLRKWGNERVYLTRETGVMAKIMSGCQLAFVSNGRTVYELAHMHVPAVVVAHHERENTHDFACAENGFWNLGAYEEGETLFALRRAFTDILEVWNGARRVLWEAMQRFDLSENKARVARRILEVANG